MAKKKNKEDYYLASQWTLMVRKLKKHKLAQISFVILAILYIVSIFGDFFAPYGIQSFDTVYKNTEPSSIHWVHEGKFVGPYVYKLTKTTINRMDEYLAGTLTDPSKITEIIVEEDKSEYYPVKFFVKGEQYKVLGLFTMDLHLFGTPKGSNGGEGAKIYLFGGDISGNDLFSRIILGGRISLTIPFASAFISFFLGILLGGLSGYFGGVLDMFIQRVIEVIGAVPQIPLWMAFSAAIPPGVSPVKMYVYITIILSFINWTGMARIVRGKFLSLKNEDYVMAARLAGVSTWDIIWKHLVPGFMSYLIVSLTLGIPGSIVGETSMSYLGLGIKAPATSWGVLLNESGTVTEVAACPWKLIPIIFVTITVLAYNFLGDGLRDAADPYK